MALLSAQRSEQLEVRDLPKRIAFYQQANGLQVGRRLGWFALDMLGASSAGYLLLSLTELWHRRMMWALRVSL